MHPRNARGDAFARNFTIRRVLRVMSAICGATLPLVMTPANAGAWIPAAGTGRATSMFRYSYADQSFPAGSFSTKTQPSTKERKAQIRVTGEHGLGNGFSLDYDLRYGILSHSKTKKGITTVNTNAGFQDQRIGINYGLRQEKHFADAIGFGIVVPGGSGESQPALDSGQWALEPVYSLGFKPGFAHLTVLLDVGMRAFLDGGAAQFRTHVALKAPISRRVRLIGTMFFVRTARMSGYDNARDRGELYDLLRFGIGMQYRLTDKIEPILAYESDIAGMGRHADHRFTVGVKLKY